MSKKDKVVDNIKDLSCLIQHHNNVLANLRREKDALVQQEKLEKFETVVSDHAIVRYLERMGLVDMEELRHNLRRLAKEASRFKGKKQKIDHYWHPSGIVMVLNGRGDIVTVLGPEQAEKFEGRKLARGDQAVKLEDYWTAETFTEQGGCPKASVGQSR